MQLTSLQGFFLKKEKRSLQWFLKQKVIERESASLKHSFSPPPLHFVIGGRRKERDFNPICPRSALCPGNIKPEGSPILPHEPAKIKQEEGKDLTRPSRPAVSLKCVL